MDVGSLAEESARLRGQLAEELAWAERWQGHHEGLLQRQARLRARLQARSLRWLEQAARALQEELEEAQGAQWEQREQNCRHQHHVRHWEKENERLAESVQELEENVSRQRAAAKTHKQVLQQLRLQGDELQRQLGDLEAKRQARADRIQEKQRHTEELSWSIQRLSRRIQVLRRNISCWGDGVMEAQQEAELCQREVLNGPPGAPPGGPLWEERVRDQTEKLLCQDAGGSGTRGRLPPRLQAAGWLLWALAKALFLALLGALVLRQPCPPASGPWLYVCPKEMLPPKARGAQPHP